MMSHYKALTVLALALHIVSACYNENIIDISAGDLMPNGDIVYDGVVFEKGDYSVESPTRKTACHKPIVRKCCPFGEVADLLQCFPSNDTFDGVVWNEYNVIEGAKLREMFRFKPEKMNCTLPNKQVMASALGDLDWNDRWHMRWDGKLHVELTDEIPPWTLVPSDRFCIDLFIYEDETGNNQTRLDALACLGGVPDEKDLVMRSACMLISCAFILVTVLVYAWLPELRNIHGRILMAYLTCLFVGFVCSGSLQLMILLDIITQSACVILTIIIYFALQSAFFWLNVMCFDIWWTFSGKGGMGFKNVSKRFFAYSIYAFGVPTIFTIILVSLEFAGLPVHPLLPLIFYQGCFLVGKSKMLYFYGPMFILCIANIVFFIMTAVKLAQIKKQTAVLYSEDSAVHNQYKMDKQRFLLNVKFFAIMGINWILEVISSLCPDADIWKVTNVYNALIGVIIFIIFVCKRNIYHLIKKRYRHLRGDSISSNQTMSTRTR